MTEMVVQGATEALEGDGEGERWERASSSLPLLAGVSGDAGPGCVCLSVKEAVFKAPFHSLLAAT